MVVLDIYMCFSQDIYLSWWTAYCLNIWPLSMYLSHGNLFYHGRCVPMACSLFSSHCLFHVQFISTKNNHSLEGPWLGRMLGSGVTVRWDTEKTTKFMKQQKHFITHRSQKEEGSMPYKKKLGRGKLSRIQCMLHGGQRTRERAEVCAPQPLLESRALLN